MPADFIIRALVAGAGVAVVAGMLGCFVIWRRMAYFGDSLAHSALLGIVLGLILDIGVNVGTMLVCSLFAVLLVWLQQKRLLATDTLLGILAHTALAGGMTATALLNAPSFDLHGYLFGDILTVGVKEIYWIYGGGGLAIALLWANWPTLTLMALSEDLARAEGVNIFAANLLLMLLMTLVVAVSLHIVGILLVTSLMIIPAAAARPWARSPFSMALLAALIGLLSVALGLGASLYLDTPSGPSIVTAAALLFAILYMTAIVSGPGRVVTVREPV